MRLGYTAGVWDLLHRGHVNLLWQSKQLCDVLVVGVVWDAGVYAYKHHWPIQNLQQRLRAIKQLGFVDVVVDQKTTDPSENIERFQPHLMTHGDDWERLKEGHETLEKYGVEFVRVPYTNGISSTMLRERIMAGAA